MDLALEGIKAEPGLFLYCGLQRLIASANLSHFNRGRFTGAYFRERTEHFYEEASATPGSRIRMAFGLPARGELPPYATFVERLDPCPGSSRLAVVQACLSLVGESLDFVQMPRGGKREDRTIDLARPTVLGCWLLLGALLSIVLPAYRRTLGIWTIIVLGYLSGVFVVSQANPRYFAPAWVVLVPLLAVPADAALVAFAAAFRKRIEAPKETTS